jgi:hypothetical protein
LRTIYQEHATGYGEEVTEKLILFALHTYHLNVMLRPVCRSQFHGVQLRESPLDCLVIEDCILLTFTALFDNNEFNINRGRSYPKALGLNWGIAANFGKTKAELEKEPVDGELYRRLRPNRQSKAHGWQSGPTDLFFRLCTEFDEQRLAQMQPSTT